MGYFVNIINSTAFLPTEHFKEAYIRMCALNTTHDHEKRGGSFGGGKPNQKWFSWMSPDYPSECADAKEVLEMLGFDLDLSDKGLRICGYDNKTGQEELFLDSISDLLTGEIEWCGEDHARWKWTFTKNGIKSQYGKVVY